MAAERVKAAGAAMVLLLGGARAPPKCQNLCVNRLTVNPHIVTDPVFLDTQAGRPLNTQSALQEGEQLASTQVRLLALSARSRGG